MKFRIVVYPPVTERSPSLLVTHYPTVEDVPVEIAVLANDGDPDGDRLSLAGVTSPSFGNVIISGDQAIYTPEENFNPRK